MRQVTDRSDSSSSSGMPRWLYWLIILLVVLKLLGIAVFLYAMQRRATGKSRLPRAVQALEELPL